MRNESFPEQQNLSALVQYLKDLQSRYPFHLCPQIMILQDTTILTDPVLLKDCFNSPLSVIILKILPINGYNFLLIDYYTRTIERVNIYLEKLNNPQLDAIIDDYLFRNFQSLSLMLTYLPPISLPHNLQSPYSTAPECFGKLYYFEDRLKYPRYSRDQILTLYRQIPLSRFKDVITQYQKAFDQRYIYHRCQQNCKLGIIMCHGYIHWTSHLHLPDNVIWTLVDDDPDTYPDIVSDYHSFQLDLGKWDYVVNAHCPTYGSAELMMDFLHHVKGLLKPGGRVFIPHITNLPFMIQDLLPSSGYSSLQLVNQGEDAEFIN